MSERAKGQLMAEMAGALVRARQSLNPVVYLEEFRDLLKKHQTGNRALLESLLSSLGKTSSYRWRSRYLGGTKQKRCGSPRSIRR
jgi:hypothetical protein